MGNAKALLLVDDEQTQVLERHVVRQKTMGANYNVRTTLHQEVHYPLLLLPGEEAGKHLNGDGKGLEPLCKGLVVLLSQNRGRYQHGDLFAIHDCFEGGPHRDLGLAIAHIAADQAIHGA